MGDKHPSKRKVAQLRELISPGVGKATRADVAHLKLPGPIQPSITVPFPLPFPLPCFNSRWALQYPAGAAAVATGRARAPLAGRTASPRSPLVIQPPSPFHHGHATQSPSPYPVPLPPPPQLGTGVCGLLQQREDGSQSRAVAIRVENGGGPGEYGELVRPPPDHGDPVLKALHEAYPHLHPAYYPYLYPVKAPCPVPVAGSQAWALLPDAGHDALLGGVREEAPRARRLPRPPGHPRLPRSLVRAHDQVQRGPPSSTPCLGPSHVHLSI